MSRVFWDTILFIYLLEGTQPYSARVNELLVRSRKRGDQMFTRYLALGEVVAGMEKSSKLPNEKLIQETLRELGFKYLAFDAGTVGTFASLRSGAKVKIADSIHLACAASAGIDLFLTGDRQLHKLIVPGIKFIADFNNPIL